MRILLDTNIVIQREDYAVLNEDLEYLMNIMNRLNIKIILHPKTFEDIKKDKDLKRKTITISKFKTYDLLETFPNPQKDLKFLDIVGIPTKANDIIDNFLLYAVYKNAVNFLITEDSGILRKASKLKISERVLSILDAINLLKKSLPKVKVKHPLALEHTEIFNLNLDDSFFDSLRTEYPNFNNWFLNKAKKGRKSFCYHKNDGSIGAILIYKIENDEIHSIPKLPKKKRLKISTMKVTSIGQKIGELLIKLAIELAIKNELLEIYITHFTKEIDYLVDLIEEYGFKKIAILKRDNMEEDIYIKKVFITKDDLVPQIKLQEISKYFYPNFYDGIEVKKHIVPIKPIFHDRLFTDFPKRQSSLFEHMGRFIIEGNTIKKAYMCNAITKKIDPGDILLFYRSKDKKSVVTLGVVELVRYNLTNENEITNLVGKRTVYSFSEISEISRKPTIVMLFFHHFHFRYFIPYQYLLEQEILRGVPQTITEINHQKYLILRKRCGIDERFTIN